MAKAISIYTSQKDLFFAAVPPDVRRRLCLADTICFNSYEAAPQIRRHSRKAGEETDRKGTAFPHIRRHSRKKKPIQTCVDTNGSS